MVKETKNNQIDQVPIQDDKTPQESVQSITEQSVDESIPSDNGDKVERNPDGTIKPGSVLNPKGRGKGTPNFSTKFFKAIDKIAQQNNMTAEEIEEQLLLVGYKKAKDGDYRFYQDIFDRVYGKPKQVQEIDFNDNTPTLAQRPDLNDAQRKVLMKLSDDVLAAEGLETYEKD